MGDMKKILFIVLTALVAVSGQAQTGWKKFGKASVPSSLILLPNEHHWAFHHSMELVSADKKARFGVFLQ